MPAELSGVTAVSAGYTHNLALKSDGTVAAWGDDTYGQTAVPPGLAGVTAVAAGTDHSVALRSDGTVVAWGDNRYGQTAVPADLSGVTAVAAGLWHNLALKSDGTVVAWGRTSSSAQSQTAVPAGLSGVVAVSGGAHHSVALKSDGTVVAWGYNNFGQTSLPLGLGFVVAIDAAVSHNLALKMDGTVVAWGSTVWGATEVPAGLSGVTAVSAGSHHSMALRSDGTIVAWGGNMEGQATVPAGLRGVTAISAGLTHSLAMVSLAPVVTLSSTSVNFGDQWLGTSSSSLPVTVANTGNAPVTINSVSASGDFMASGTCVAGASLAPDSSCTIDVTFAPTAGGPRSGTLTISHDGPDSPQLVQLAGTGVVEADLGLSMGASPNPVRSGTDLTYVITASNAGPTSATDVTVTDALPATTQFRSVRPSSGWACTTPDVGSSGMVRCRAETLAKGAQASIQLVVTVVGPGGSTLSNTATVASPSKDSHTTDNSATVATRIFGRR